MEDPVRPDLQQSVRVWAADAAAQGRWGEET